MLKRAKPPFAVAVMCFACACATPAVAQDAADVDYSLNAPAPIWSGAYVGVHAGGYSNDGTVTLVGQGMSASDSDNGFVLGLYGGYARQFGSWVVGGEVDWTTGTSSDSKDLFTVRGRVGYAFERVLVYGTAGWGMADLGTVSIGGVSRSFDFSGLVVGGGVETKISPQLSLRAEVIHFAPSNESVDFGVVNGTQVGVVEGDLQSTVYRAGLAYHFN